jgi:glycosyltransferase involved in cell wall biosynthesis
MTSIISDRRHTPTSLCIVTPVFNEIAILERYVKEVTRLFFSLSDVDAHVIIVDDGSTDGSWDKIQEIVKSSQRFSALRLSRNFGSHVALLAGFDYVPDKADIVATLACDLQDPPETILDFVAKWRSGADIVWGARKKRVDGTFRAITSRSLEALLRKFVMPRNSQFRTGSFFLIDRRVLNSVRQFREHSRVTFALVAWTGFNQAVVTYDRRVRIDGRSGWTVSQMVNTAYDILIGFSPMPAKLLTAFGFFMLFASIAAASYIIGEWFWHSVQPGWTGLMTTLTLCFGLLFVMLGISFEYLYRILLETKKRPNYFIARSVGDIRSREGTSD